METARLALYVACTVLVVVPLYFIFHSVYRDGVFGRWALGGIIFCALGVVVEGPLKALRGQTVNDAVIFAFLGWLAVAVAVFLCWHLVRFHSRFARAQGDNPCGLRNQVGCPYVPAPAAQPLRDQRAFSLRRVI